MARRKCSNAVWLPAGTGPPSALTSLMCLRMPCVASGQLQASSPHKVTCPIMHHKIWNFWQSTSKDSVKVLQNLMVCAFSCAQLA